MKSKNLATEKVNEQIFLRVLSVCFHSSTTITENSERFSFHLTRPKLSPPSCSNRIWTLITYIKLLLPWYLLPEWLQSIIGEDWPDSHLHQSGNHSHDIISSPFAPNRREKRNRTRICSRFEKRLTQANLSWLQLHTYSKQCIYLKFPFDYLRDVALNLSFWI